MLGLGLAMVKDLILVPIAGNGAFDLDSVPFFGSLGSTAEGIGVAGSVGLVLAGALPFVYCLNKLSLIHISLCRSAARQQVCRPRSHNGR